MLVDVIRMRREGVKLSAEELRAAVPVRGYLLVRTYPNKCVYPNEPPTCTEASLRALAPGEGADLLPYLSDARQKPGRDGQFVVVGRERYGHPSAYTTHPQAWWCRIVPDAEAAAGAPSPQALDLTEA